MANRAYDKIRSLVEQLGGSMVFHRPGTRHGAWEIQIGESRAILEASGNQSFPDLDRLYVPKKADPMHWDDYTDELLPDAEMRLQLWLGLTDSAVESFPVAETEELKQLIERTKWKFAWRYARIYPHEYTTKENCSPEDHAKLIDCIEQYGVAERFGKTRRKYFHFEERKYWHMGDPNSENQEDWPNVINRTWVDVRRHADHIRHVWTPEEIELQMRLWEIQLEKSTDRPKSVK